MFRCDGCKTTDEPEAADPRNRKSSSLYTRDFLPPDWTALHSKSNMSDVFLMHFCPKCTTEVSRLLTGMTLDAKPVEDVGVRDLLTRQERSGEDISPSKDLAMNEARSKEWIKPNPYKNKDRTAEDNAERKQAYLKSHGREYPFIDSPKEED